MHNKLRVGIILTADYNPESGGGFGYYESLIKAIDNYHFNALLEFVFIQKNEGPLVQFNKEVLHYQFDTSIPEIAHCNTRIKQINAIPLAGLRLPLRKKYEDRIALLTNSKLDEEKSNFTGWLVKQQIDVLYYLTPGGGEYNFPFVTTHWDIGHFSMYAFPEVSMDGGFEWREGFYEKVHKKALAVFCESETGKAELVRYKQINPNRIFVVPLFAGKMIHLQIGLTDQQSLIEQRFSIAPKKYFVYPAQFWAHKNHYHLLLAFKKVAGSFPDLKLVLPGSDKGNLLYVHELIESFQMKASVSIPGFISNEELYSLYNNAIALVMPTFLGPTNMPLLEAAYLGCPVITTDLIGHREILGDYATYIDPLDENSIADAMIHSVSDSSEGDKKFTNNINTIETAITQIENNFLQVRKVRKTW